MASKEAYNHFLKPGYPVDEYHSNRFDSLEPNDDLELLFSVLNCSAMLISNKLYSRNE